MTKLFSPKLFFSKKIFQIFSRKRLFIQGITIAIIMLILDLYSKNLVFFSLHDHADQQYSQYPRKIITDFFSLVYVNNNGISFGMFDQTNHAREIFSFLQGSIATALLIWLWRCQKKHISIALGLIIGGAYGNVIDRVMNGGVTDFLDFHISIYHWPAFNLADSVIFIGVCIILFDEFFIKKT